ncbi:hypothetical protein GCM10027586_09280 [Kineococcus gypseus]|uniref:hypothetical protein n=1 Tax=Kineococcus gypseus TaxID=1637102 RepID=UPI003D7EE500
MPPTTSARPGSGTGAASRLPAMGAQQATAALGVTPQQLRKLRECGLLGTRAALEALRSPGGQWRYPYESIRQLHERARVDLPSAGEDLAVHVAPLQLDENGQAHQRTHLGWSAHAVQAGLSAQQVEDAWAGLWSVRDPQRHVGAALVADVAGFVVEVARVTGWRLIAGDVRFEVEAPTAVMLQRYAGRRFHAAPGDTKQRLISAPAPT